MDEKIKCPKCGGNDIILAVQYRRYPVLRVINALLIIIIALIIIFNLAELAFNDALKDITRALEKIQELINPKNENSYTKPSYTTSTIEPIIIFLFFALTISEITQHTLERKPRLYYICKDCKKIWYEPEDEFFEEP